MSFNIAPEIFTPGPVQVESMQHTKKDSLTDQQQSSEAGHEAGKVVTLHMTELELLQVFPDGHYSGSPNFDPDVYGAD